ncbi:hypothetical protein QJS04_geneDACA007567 [Acorus gramineus]|uniref:TmcB/TmcC TPR repeats domain-containing protein n=1 Tax=Acorus gramineus TaxID=55184 RepID=A0AAV9B2Y3_ACOGR|nr:hypothetical protein QJS04_geneDACA007567 [Acorus gramineus]
MSIKVGSPVVPHSQTLASAVASPSSSSAAAVSTSWRRRRIHLVPRPDPSVFLSSRLTRTRSWDNSGGGCPSSSSTTLRRAFSASFDAFSTNDDDEEEDEFVKRLQELALKFTVSDDEKDEPAIDSRQSRWTAPATSADAVVDPPMFGIRPEPAMDFEAVTVERTANSVGLPLSLRIIKQKKRWESETTGGGGGGNDGGLMGTVGETAYCSFKKAFSSMVFIIRELQSYTLQMREVLSHRDMRGILVRVQKEMHASFVWLFERIFSPTPTLMVYLMLLLANFTVYSMGHDIAIAAATASTSPPPQVEWIDSAELQQQQRPMNFDAPSMKSITGRTASIGENGDGGGKARPIAGATDDGGHRGVSLRPAIAEEDEKGIWESMVEEAEAMARVRLDHETMRGFVLPFTVAIQADDRTAYFKTELVYLQAIEQEPNNSMVLSNYAQFLYLVVNDHDRAEEYFKRATKVEPADAETLSRYASFLWMARNDLSAAEETYLEAIAAEPSNTAYAAGYAHFLWSTGGEDTCFPLDCNDSYDDDDINYA